MGLKRDEKRWEEREEREYTGKAGKHREEN